MEVWEEVWGKKTVMFAVCGYHCFLILYIALFVNSELMLRNINFLYNTTISCDNI